MTYRSLNPATGETVREFADISDADLHTALQAAQTAYRADWRQRPAADRAHIMKAAAAELRANAAEYAGYITAEMGKLIGTSEAEVGLSAAILDYYAETGMVYINQPAWTAPEIPFGAVKNSGFGRELSELGFGEFVNRKLVNAAPAGAPPWGPVPA